MLHLMQSALKAQVSFAFHRCSFNCGGYTKIWVSTDLDVRVRLDWNMTASMCRMWGATSIASGSTFVSLHHRNIRFDHVTSATSPWDGESTFSRACTVESLQGNRCKSSRVPTTVNDFQFFVDQEARCTKIGTTGSTRRSEAKLRTEKASPPCKSSGRQALSSASIFARR